jgi:glycosyltransferase involved in cell wall biosynthesis
MPRIGIDARSLAEKGTGAGRYLANLLKYYQDIDSNNQYFLYLNRPVEGLAARYASRVIKMPGIPFSMPWMNIRLPLALIKDKIDLLHLPFFGYPFIRPCPTVITIHDIVFESHPEYLPLHKTAVLRTIFRHAARTTKKIIAVSEYTKSDLIKYYGVKEDKVEVIYEAPDPIFRRIIESSKSEQKKLAYGITKKYILCVGAIHKRKNIEMLLRAFKELSPKKEGVQLVLVGGVIWNSVDLTRMIAEQGLAGNVIHLKYVPDEDLVYIYNSAEILVYPSLYEGFGLPLVEAMACGTPVVASNVTSIPEVVGNAGILFDPYNVEDMAGSMDIVLKDSGLRGSLSKKSIERAKAFSWRNTAERTIGVYNGLIRNP